MASQSGYGDAGSSGLGILSPRLGPRDLPSKRLLGTGVASVGYETELDEKKYARKDFMGVPSGTFTREAARLVGLEDHTNVVKTFGWTENKTSCSLVLEYMDDDLLGILQKRKQSQGSMEAGPKSGNQSDLDSRNTIKRAPFELPEALYFMLQIARGMEYLADKGIRHGNLKTKNILVTRTDDRDRNSLSVKVADFGLVRTRRKSTSFASRQARKLDMARWTAPEFLQVFLLEDKGETSSESDSDEDCTDSSYVTDSDVPEWKELDADVYSFAVTCSQILTGEDPYPNLNWKELGVEIVRHGLTPTLPSECPSELRKLLVSCWDFDPFRLHFLERPSFSHIRSTLERLQQMDLPARFLPLPEKAPMDITRAGQVWELITVEDLWGATCLQQHAACRPDPPAGLRESSFCVYQMLVLDVAYLIMSTRTVVRRRPEWTRLREELELMLPDMLRMRNRWWSYARALDGKDHSDWRMPMSVWSRQLNFVVREATREVGKHQQQEDDRSLLSSLSAAFTESRRVSKLRNDINQLAKRRKKILLAVIILWRQAQVRAKEQAKAEIGVGTSALLSGETWTKEKAKETSMSVTGPSATADVTSSSYTALDEWKLPFVDEIAPGDFSGAGSSMQPKSEYFSALIEEMMRSKSQLSSDVALIEEMMRSKSQLSSDVAHEIEHSRAHWSDVSSLSDSSEDNNDYEEVNRENEKVFAELLNDPQSKQPRRFGAISFKWKPYLKVGRKIKEGGLSEIFEVTVVGTVHPTMVLKVFPRGSRLSDFREQWPREILEHLMGLTMLDDGRLAIAMNKFWGDLRKLIDQAMREKKKQGPPFPYEWHGLTLHAKDIMRDIAHHMDKLHKQGFIHRDLRGTNILLYENDKGHAQFVVDFEPWSIRVVGIGFWRAPEILLALKNRSAMGFSEKSDVYSYGMTCFEIVTGRFPFEGELKAGRASYDPIIGGRRPKLPSDLDVTLKDLIERCWNSNPNERPSFAEILVILDS